LEEDGSGQRDLDDDDPELNDSDGGDLMGNDDMISDDGKEKNNNKELDLDQDISEDAGDM